jgi:hypothetical protein
MNGHFVPVGNFVTLNFQLRNIVILEYFSLGILQLGNIVTWEHL